MKRNLTCIICPKGCSLVAQIRDHEVSVSGNACPKGEQYAIDECLHPMRTVTATVRVANRHHTMVSVKTQQPVPKERMMDVMAMLRRISVNAPVSIGDVVLTDVFGTNVIVTKAID
jgi:CxxC motif-containing protein